MKEGRRTRFPASRPPATSRSASHTGLRATPGRWSLALATGLALAFAGLRPAFAQDVGLPLGAKPTAPVIEDLNGDSVDLASYIGKTPVLMEFWATWCPLCRAMEPKLRAAHRKFGDDVQFLFIGVAVNQTPRSIRRHLAKDPLPGPVLWDADGAAVRAFDAPTTSYIVILDRSGKVAYTGSGSDQDVDAALASVLGAASSGRDP